MLGTNPSSEIPEISTKPIKQDQENDNLNQNQEEIPNDTNLDTVNMDGKHEEEIINGFADDDEEKINDNHDEVGNEDGEEEEEDMTRSIIPMTQTIPSPEFVIEEPPSHVISQTATIVSSSQMTTPNVTLARYDVDLEKEVKECFACKMNIVDESPIAVFGRYWHTDCFRGEVRGFIGFLNGTLTN
jgi:hypothetical protein